MEGAAILRRVAAILDQLDLDVIAREERRLRWRIALRLHCEAEHAFVERDRGRHVGDRKVQRIALVAKSLVESSAHATVPFKRSRVTGEAANTIFAPSHPSSQKR